MSKPPPFDPPPRSGPPPLERLAGSRPPLPPTADTARLRTPQSRSAVLCLVLAVASLLCFPLGLPLGIAALALGLKAIRTVIRQQADLGDDDSTPSLLGGKILPSLGICLALAGMLLGVVSLNATWRLARSIFEAGRAVACEDQLERLGQAVTAYRQEHGFYPAGSDDLDPALIAGLHCKAGGGPYIVPTNGESPKDLGESYYGIVTAYHMHRHHGSPTVMAYVLYPGVSEEVVHDIDNSTILSATSMNIWTLPPDAQYQLEVDDAKANGRPIPPRPTASDTTVEWVVPPRYPGDPRAIPAP